MDKKKQRLAATLWFVAAALSLLAVGLNYAKEGEIKATYVATALFAIALGLAALRSSKSNSV